MIFRSVTRGFRGRFRLVLAGIQGCFRRLQKGFRGVSTAFSRFQQLASVGFGGVLGVFRGIQ